MPYVVADRVKETSTSTGTGNFTLAGAATGFRTFNSAIGVSNTTTYVITDATGAQWEVGFGTLSGSTTLVRTQVFSSSNAGSAVNFSAGTKTVFVSMSAAPSSSNTSLGTALGFSPNTLQFTTVLGYGASVTADYATAVGQSASATGSNGVAVGGAAVAAQSSTAVGQQATASGGGSSAYGVVSVASGGDSVALGNSAQSAGLSAVAVGASASASDNDSVAVGPVATASGGNSSAFGRGSTASGVNAVAVGQGANAGGANAVVIGSNANSSQDSAVSIGLSASGQIPEAVSVGAYSSASGTTAPYNNAVVVGSSSFTFGGITIGADSTPTAGLPPKSGTTIIGHGITALEDDATYMNKFRTGVTPVGTSWFLKWDDFTQEVYAEPGTPPAGMNWYAYQTQPAPGAAFSVAMPSGMPTGSFGFGNSLFSTQSTFGGTPSPSGAWTYVGSTSLYSAVYSVGTPQPSPENYFGSAFGVIIIYYRGYETDSGATATVDVNTGTTLYSTFSNNFFCSPFSVFGTTQYGHAIVAMNANVVGLISPSAGVTLVEEFYDSAGNTTYAFFDLDSSSVSAVSSGAAIANTSVSATYNTIFWYNYV